VTGQSDTSFELPLQHSRQFSLKAFKGDFFEWRSFMRSSGVSITGLPLGLALQNA
jgi:hypothetical protein